MEKNSRTQTDNLRSMPPVQFAAERLKEALNRADVYCPYTLTPDESLPPQCYDAQFGADGLSIRAADPEAAMHALLDLKDSVEATGQAALRTGLHRPYIMNRGIKLNVPLDARTPSYSDCGDSAQGNIAFMWEESFWFGLLDRMALQRYNALTLWNLCPFPSMVRVPEFPDAALEDVMVSSVMTRGTSRALDFYNEDMRKHLVCVRRMTVEEKTAFWHRVFDYARDRCVRIYIFTWNLYLYGLEESCPALRESVDDLETARYIRCSVAALLRTYPTLAGIGVTAGENMCVEWTEEQDMHWVRETYGRGVEDVIAEDPGRQVTLICRTHQTTLPQLLEAFSDFRGELELSSKYAMAHMTALERPRFSDPLIATKPEGMGLWLTIRQDEFYLFPWADDLFLGDMMSLLPKDDLRGFYFGADGLCWGVENQSRSPEVRNRYWFDKHFFVFALMGRLGYSGYLTEPEKQAVLREFMPGLPDGPLLQKYRRASRAVRLISLAHWRHYDFQWYPEACCYLNEPGHITVFDDLDTFLDCGACPNSGVASVRETAEGCPERPISSLDIAEEILREADQADDILLPEGRSYRERELKADLERITALARYYAWKLRAAVALERGRSGPDAAELKKAAECMRKAAACWHAYSAETARWYRPQRLSRLEEVVSPDMWDERVERDILICEDRRLVSCSH
ncbi:MAG: hypothetical protein K5922_04045 [Clostridiales bacterium]|nr:hypothetical protein [Clostridiales bacterium]